MVFGTLMMSCAGPAAAMGVVPAPHVRNVPVLDADGEAPATDKLRVAQRLLRLGNHAAALRVLDGAVDESPHHALAHLGRAICLAELGREEEASDALSAVLACPMEDGFVALQLACASARKGAHALAMGLLEVAVQATPALAQRALDEPAFRQVRDHPRFLMIVGAI